MYLSVAFDGISGAGKTTCARLVHSALKGRGSKVLVFNEKEHEPLRSWAISWHARNRNSQVFSEQEVENVALCRSRLQSVHLPSYTQYDAIFFDRSIWTSVVYQSFDGVSPEDVLRINLERGVTLPDLTFIFLADPHLCATRVRFRAQKRSTYNLPSNIEDETSIARTYVRYSEILQLIPYPVIVDGSKTPKENAWFVLGHILSHLP